MTDSCTSSSNKTTCSTTDTGCKTTNNKENLAEYWCNQYTNVDYKKLGWYELESVPSLELILKTRLGKNALIFNVGAGSTTLIDTLLEKGYSNLIVNDISSCALNNIKKRIGNKQNLVEFIVDDIVNPTILQQLPKVDIWNDRAVLHFFTEEKDQKSYFNLLKEKVKNKGFVILAEFDLQGANKCSGLDVKQYNTKMLQEKLGSEFKLLENFNHDYVMPSGEIRKYIYTLFQRLP